MPTYTVQVKSKLTVHVRLNDDRTLMPDEAREIARPFVGEHGQRTGIGWSFYDCARSNYNAMTLTYEGDYGGVQTVER